MALEELHSTVSKFSFDFFGTETEKKVGRFLFDEKKEWATSRELHGLAALTFNAEQCAGVMTVLGKALEPKDNSWRALHKAIKLLHHFVLYGAERCVDHAWNCQKKVEDLRRYNSAIHGRTASLNGGGTDFGAPVRKAAEELDALLKGSSAIRAARAKRRPSDSLLPIGAEDDYTAPEAPKAIDLGVEDAFGVVPEGTVGAKYDLQQIPGLYEGRPERYFDDKDDPRAGKQQVEDSDHTRQAQAPDLLDLDIGETQSASIPDAQDLLRLNKQTALERQLREQQEQLEQLKHLMRLKVQQGTPGGDLGEATPASGLSSGGTSLPSGMAGVARGPGSAPASALAPSASGVGTAGTAGRVDKVTDAFGSLDLGGGQGGADGSSAGQTGHFNASGLGIMAPSSGFPHPLGGGAGGGFSDQGMSHQLAGVARNGVGGVLGAGPRGMVGTGVLGAGVGGGRGAGEVNGGSLGVRAGTTGTTGLGMGMGMGMGQRGQMQMRGANASSGMLGVVGAGAMMDAPSGAAGALNEGMLPQGMRSNALGGLGQEYGSWMGGSGIGQQNSSGRGVGTGPGSRGSSST